jgi:hypothetical protein
MLRRPLALLAVTIGMIVTVAATPTTTVGAASFAYDGPTIARVDVREFEIAGASPAQLSGSREGSASPSAEGWGTSTTPAAPVVATKAVPSPGDAADLVRGANPVGSALKSDAVHRSASFVVDDIAANGTVFRTVGGDGVTRTLVQVPGELNGFAGRFEWIVDDVGNLTHQMFVKGGSINGVPIAP